MTGSTPSPPQSFPSSPSFHASRSSHSSSPRPVLSLDLSNLPPLSQPTPPSNTLLITDLHDLYLFQPSSLAAIRSHIESTARLNSFSPLPSFRRIVCSFLSEADAIRVRQLLDGETLLNRGSVRTKIYFGEPTPIIDSDAGPKLLAAPQVDKLFFISPPPSPPAGWVLRPEDPPNREVHASDLAQALSKLNTDHHHHHHHHAAAGPLPACELTPHPDPDTPMSLSSDKRTPSWPLAAAPISQQRSRSSTLIYNPEEHGSSPNLPAVLVEDTSASFDDMDVDVEVSPIETSIRQMPPKTARPPVELMA
ncbi:hypothetical protein ARAM_004969 [Aspergillus rambellii]|uniref:Calcineurin binding protein n=1 Tax=Aspergillus rambellii TaxID=308745 RepID=A0A0F8W5T0_9EURO|nr:hypothetical protein ARAM_004969 [Aspergillus rambellii]